MISEKLLLEKGAAYRHGEAGEVIFREGDGCAFYHQLSAGRLRWANFREDGREVLHRIVLPGECFGDLPLADGETQTASAVADSACTLLRLRQEAFRELLADRPDIHLAFTKHLAEHLRFKFFLTELLAGHRPEVALSKLIDYFYRQEKFVCGNCGKLQLTRRQMADMTGFRTETVIRAIRQMQKNDKLEVVRGKVFVPMEGRIAPICLTSEAPKGA